MTSTIFPNPPPGPFVASGPAVGAGLVCPAGLVHDDSIQAQGFPSGQGFNVQVVKHFICDEAPFGEFFVNLQARIDFRKGTTFSWNVVGGTGVYDDLHGAGSGVGLFDCGANCILDVYEGGLRIR